MKSFVQLITVLGAALLTRYAWGHGRQIIVDVNAGSLEVSNGLADAVGFASMMWVESDDAGDPYGDVPQSPFGPIRLWEVPGFELHNLEENSGLYLEVLPRPEHGSGGQRLLWYWDPVTEMVKGPPTTAEFHLLNQFGSSLTILPDQTTAPSPLLIANPTAADQGFHNHLLGYALEKNPIAVAGAYGFFARLTSDLYEASEPFLVVINNLVPYDKMIPAALEINAAAIPEGLPGDYNGNGIVDAADYTVWRDARAAGATELLNDHSPGTVDREDFLYWRAHFGESLCAGGTASTAVPEPTTWLLAAIAAMLLAGTSRDLSRRS